MGVGDVPWAAEMMEARRQVYASYSPVFWRPANDVVELHGRFLERQLQDPANVGLRTDHAFLMGQLRGEEGVVDDFAVDQQPRWANEGRELVGGAWQALRALGATRLRVVTAKADFDKVSMLLAASLQLAEEWWVKEVRPSGGANSPRSVKGTRFSGVVGPAPPVYDPGGPVLLARLEPDADLAVLEAEAADLGAVLAVVAVAPSSEYVQRLQHRSWTVASQWYVGRPGTGPGDDEMSRDSQAPNASL